MKNKKEFKFSLGKLILIIVVSAVLITGGTFAAMYLSITNGNYAYKTTCFDIFYDAGKDITGDLFPSSMPLGGLTGSVTIGVDESCNVSAKGNLYLTTESNNEGNTKLTEIVEAHCEEKNTLRTLTSYNSESACTANSNAIWVKDGSALKYAVYDENNTSILSSGYVNKIGEVINIYSNFKLKSSSK